MISRIELSRPPGVSSLRIATAARRDRAASSPRTMKSRLAGPMAPRASNTSARPVGWTASGAASPKLAGDSSKTNATQTRMLIPRQAAPSK